MVGVDFTINSSRTSVTVSCSRIIEDKITEEAFKNLERPYTGTLGKPGLEVRVTLKNLLYNIVTLKTSTYIKNTSTSTIFIESTSETLNNKGAFIVNGNIYSNNLKLYENILTIEITKSDTDSDYMYTDPTHDILINYKLIHLTFRQLSSDTLSFASKQMR